MEKSTFSKSANEALRQAQADNENEDFESEQRKPVVEMLKRSIPGFTEWGNAVLTAELPADAVEEVKKFPEGIYALPDDLQDSWSPNVPGSYSGIYFNNPANGRQFEIQYSIVETDAPGQKFVKPEARKKVKAVSVVNTWSISSFSN